MHEWSGKWCWMIIPIHHHPFARETFTRLSECDSPRPMVTEFQIAILADGPKLVLCGLLVKEFVNLLWTNISSWVYNYNLHGLLYIAKTLSFDLGEPWRIVFSGMGQVCPGTPRCPHDWYPTNVDSLRAIRHGVRGAKVSGAFGARSEVFRAGALCQGKVGSTGRLGNSGGSIRNIYLHPCLGTCLYLWDLWEIIGMNTNLRFQSWLWDWTWSQFVGNGNIVGYIQQLREMNC